MRMKHRAMAILLSLVMVLTFMPAMAFAEDDDEYYNATATYNGLPFFTYTDDADFWGDEGDSITVNYKGVSTTYVVEEFYNQNPYEDWDFWTYNNIIHNPTDPYDIVFYRVVVEDQKATLYLNKYDDGENWHARIVFDEDDAEIYNSVDRISFKPNAVTLYSEDIKEIYADGSYDYKFEKRSVHSMNGQTWESPYSVGDQLIVYQDNRATTYTNTDIDTDDYPELDADYKYEDYFVSADKKEIFYLPYICGDEDEYLKPGNNTITFYYHGRTTTMNVFVETPESRAAEKAKKDAEAAAKAKAETEAKARALAAATNINKGTVSASDIKKASSLGATEVILGSKVKKISKNAFKGTNIKTVIVKTKKLKAKTVKGSLKGSKVKTIKVQIGSKKTNKKYIKSYKKIFTKKNAGKKASVK